jgi:hypothetical protein
MRSSYRHQLLAHQGAVQSQPQEAGPQRQVDCLQTCQHVTPTSKHKTDASKETVSMPDKKNEF